jgi:hypothetical protein
MNKTILATSVLALALTAGGCAARVGYYGEYVSTPPPPPRREIIGVAPGPGFVWIEGYYAWRPAGGYYWVPGHWERPPRPRAHWVPGRWVRTRHGWVWREGGWR